jgi:hypothetical protein
VLLLADSSLKRAVIFTQQNCRQPHGSAALTLPAGVEARGVPLDGLEFARGLDRRGLASQLAEFAIGELKQRT